MRRANPIGHRDRQAGFTLVEVLVCLAIMGLIAPVLANTLTVGWRTTEATVSSLSDSRNRALTPSLFTRDVQNAVSVDTLVSDATCTTAGDTLLVRLRWTETAVSGTATSRAVSWVLTSGGDRLLERRWCAAGTSVTSSVTTAHGVVGTPTVTCTSLAGATVACGSATRVSLAVTDTSGAFTASGSRRAS